MRNYIIIHNEKLYNYTNYININIYTACVCILYKYIQYIHIYYINKTYFHESRLIV